MQYYEMLELEVQPELLNLLEIVPLKRSLFDLLGSLRGEQQSEIIQ